MKRIFYTAFLVLAMFFLAGCSASIKNEREMIQDLENHGDFYSVQDVKISELSVIKRQTDKSEKNDSVYVTVTASNENIECTLGYQLIYSLYDQGWVLDYVYPYQEGEWSIVPIAGAEQTIADSIVGE